MASEKPWENASGLPDPTAYNALKKISEEDQRVGRTIHLMKDIAELAGFKVINRIELRDTKTGEVHR